MNRSMASTPMRRLKWRSCPGRTARPDRTARRKGRSGRQQKIAMAEPLVAFGRFLGSVTLAGVMLLSPLSLDAQESPVATGLASANPAGTPETHTWWRGITTNGFLSISYAVFCLKKKSTRNQFRVFHFNDNEPQLDVPQW